MSEEKINHRWRIFVEEKALIEKAIVTLCEEETHYVRNVLRLSSQETVELFDGNGNMARGSIYETSKKTVSVQIEEMYPQTLPSKQILVLCGFPKPANLADVVASACETGASELVLFAVPGKMSINEVRLKKIAREALRVSKWPWETKLFFYKDLKEAWSHCEKVQPSYFWCDELLCFDKPQDVETLTRAAEKSSDKNSVTIIGPEAGFSAQDREFLEKNKIKKVALGPCVLRVPVAVTAAVTALHQI